MVRCAGLLCNVFSITEGVLSLKYCLLNDTVIYRGFGSEGARRE